MYVYVCVSMCMYMYTSNIYCMYIYSIKFHSPNQAAKVGPSEDIGPQCYLPSGASGNANIDAMDGEMEKNNWCAMSLANVPVSITNYLTTKWYPNGILEASGFWDMPATRGSSWNMSHGVHWFLPKCCSRRILPLVCRLYPATLLMTRLRSPPGPSSCRLGLLPESQFLAVNFPLLLV